MGFVAILVAGVIAFVIDKNTDFSHFGNIVLYAVTFGIVGVIIGVAGDSEKENSSDAADVTKSKSNKSAAQMKGNAVSNIDNLDDLEKKWAAGEISLDEYISEKSRLSK